MEHSLRPLRHFIEHVRDAAADHSSDSFAELLIQPMRKLLATDAWLPDAMAVTNPTSYQQYLLYADPADRFSLVSFVWGPGQRTPIHDHTVWGVIGVLRGAEYSQRYDVSGGGAPRPLGSEKLFSIGDVDIVSPSHGDVHVVRNAHQDRVSISIHVYGGNIGKIQRSVFDAQTGRPKHFVSGYSAVLDAIVI